MRPRHVLTPLAVGLAARALVRRRRARRAQAAHTASAAANFSADPRDPVQSLDDASDLEVGPLDVEAMSRADAEAAEDLAALEIEGDEEAEADEAAADETAADAAEADEAAETEVPAEAAGDAGGDADDGADIERRRDTGELYGAHTPPAADRELPDDDRAYTEGQNWLEALETTAVENGPEPERSLDDIVDDDDVLAPPHASDTRDRPVADRGAGGRRGL